MNVPSSVVIPKIVAPGETVDVSILMRTPLNPGVYRSNFKLQNAEGVLFGLGENKEIPFWIEVKVQESIIKYDFVENSCLAQWFSAAGTLPCSGEDGDSRGTVLKVNNPKLENGKIDTSPGLLTLPQKVQNGYIMGTFPPYRVQRGDYFQSIVNCESGATECFVVFRLDYQIDNGELQTYWAFVEQYEGISYPADIDISSLAGQNVKFTLSVFAVGPADDDRAIWGGPKIIHKFATPTLFLDLYDFR